MRIVPLTLKPANDFVEKWHRHSSRTSNDGGKFAIGLEHDGELVGVAIVGRPVSRILQVPGGGRVAAVLHVAGRAKGRRLKTLFASETHLAADGRDETTHLHAEARERCDHEGRRHPRRDYH